MLWRQNMSVTTYCVVCGKEKIVSNHHAKKTGNICCSRECSIKLQRKNKKEMKCVLCGKVFLKSPSSVADYCSRECSDKSKISRTTIVCIECGRTKEIRNTQMKRYNQRFCSSKCFGKHNSYLNENYIPKQKSMKVLVNCMNCNKEFLVHRYREISAKFCSRKCKHEFGIGYYSFWQHGISKTSQELFNNIRIGLKLENCFYGDFNNEKYLRDETNKTGYFLDFICGNKVIEYNGNKWHGDPQKYSSEDVLINGKVAGDVWDRDDKKYAFLRENGYEVLIIWEDEYLLNKSETISKCFDFMETDRGENGFGSSGLKPKNVLKG